MDRDTNAKVVKTTAWSIPIRTRAPSTSTKSAAAVAVPLQVCGLPQLSKKRVNRGTKLTAREIVRGSRTNSSTIRLWSWTVTKLTTCTNDLCRLRTSGSGIILVRISGSRMTTSSNSLRHLCYKSATRHKTEEVKAAGICIMTIDWSELSLTNSTSDTWVVMMLTDKITTTIICNNRIKGKVKLRKKKKKRNNLLVRSCKLKRKKKE